MITETEKKAKEYEITSSRAFLNFKNDIKFMFEWNKENGIWEINVGGGERSKDAISDFLTKLSSLKCMILFIRISFTVPPDSPKTIRYLNCTLYKGSIFPNIFSFFPKSRKENKSLKKGK